jgi:hypothetical protein
VALERVVLRALEKERERRFRTASEFRSALREALPRAGALPGASGVLDVVRSGGGERITLSLDIAGARAWLASQWARLPGRVQTGARRARDAWRALPARARHATLGGAAIVLVALAIALGRGGSPEKPKPVAPAVAGPVKLAEAALTNGDVARARVILTEELS